MLRTEQPSPAPTVTDPGTSAPHRRRAGLTGAAGQCGEFAPGTRS